jgi:hypothetical protein
MITIIGMEYGMENRNPVETSDVMVTGMVTEMKMEMEMNV